MSSLDRKVNIFLKKFLPQQQITDNFLEYLLKQTRDTFARSYQQEGIFSGSDFSANAADKFNIQNPLYGTDGHGHVMLLDPTESTVQFENANGINYHVGLRYNEIVRETEINVRTGEIEYTFVEERIGEKAQPNLVTDNGTTLTFRVDSVTEPGVSNAGRKCRVWKKRAAGQADAFFEGVVQYVGGFNVLNTTHLLGQTAGLVSTNPADYEVFLAGPTVKKNTALNNDPNYVYLGYVVGAGAGNIPTNWNQTGRTLLFGTGSVSSVIDATKSFITGGGLITWNLPTQTLSFTQNIQIVLPNRSWGFTIAPTSVNSLADNDVLYIMMDVIGGIKPMIKVASGSMPHDPLAYPIALRKGNDIYFHNGTLELKGDNTGTTSGRINDITQDLLTFIGADSETDSDPQYSSTNEVSQGAPLTTAISQLDQAILAIQNDAAEEEEFLVTNPLGETNFTCTTLSWLFDHTIPDIKVYVNGIKQRQSKTGALDKDFRKVSTNEIEFAYTVPAGASVEFRDERMGDGGAGGNLSAKDEGVTISTSPISALDFVGSGVVVQELSPGLVRVTIPGVGGGVENIQKLVYNNTGSVIPANSVLAWADDGSVQLADANINTKADFAGINPSSINHGQYGYAIKSGNIPNGANALGAIPGQPVYLGENPGELTLTAPSGLTDTVLKIGRAEPPNGLAQPNATDLYLELEVLVEP